MDDREFETSRKVLASKRKELKQKGKGNRPHAAEAITSEERGILKQKAVIGLQSPRQLLNQVWLNNSTLFGIRGGTESHNLRWGDIKLKKTDQGREYLEYNERLTKTRTSETKSDQRAFPPKQFAHTNKDSCPVEAYKEFAHHRPKEALRDDAPFYLCINYSRHDGSNKWYKCQPMGENSLRSIMRTMAERGDLTGRKTNHSARKTTCTTLLHNGVAPTTIQQLTGHKNVQSVNNYAKASLEMQAAMSDILSENPDQQQIMQLNPRPTYGSVIPASVRNTSMSSSNKNTSNAAIDDSHDNTNLQGAQLFRCNVTINNYYAHSPSKKRKRICIVESDSD